MFILLAFLSSFTLLLGKAYGQETIESLSQRIKELELKQLALEEEPKPKVNSFLNNNLTFGGFFEPGYTIIDGEDTRLQTATANILAFNMSADFKSGFRFMGQYVLALGVTQQNEHNDPRSTPSDRNFGNLVSASLLTQGILEYSFSQKFNIQGGLGYSPFGYAFQERELVLFHRRGGPQMLRSTNSYVSQLWEGIHVHGSINQGKNLFGYNAYTFTPPSKLNALGVGARSWLANESRNIVAGVSGQVAKGDEENTKTLGVDFKYDFFPFSIRSEALKRFSQGTDPWSIYVEPSVLVMDEEVLLYIFGDYASSPENTTGGLLSDPIKKWEYGGGVNWLPTSYTRLRLGLTYHDYTGNQVLSEIQERDYLSLDISAGVAF